MANKKTKRKDYSMASIRRRLSAAVLMLLISVVVLVTSTYAWFTLSTAPEVKGIDTSVAGNGSLEIALMPASGSFTDIRSGRNASGDFAGGTQPVTVANNNWGNIVNLSDVRYGLGAVTLKPARLNVATQRTETPEYYEDDNGNYTDPEGNPVDEPIVRNTEVSYSYTLGNGALFQIPEYGYDGRIARLVDTNLRTHYTDATYTAAGTGFEGNLYGVRAIVDDAGNAYGYAIDLAVRLNSNNADGSTGKLLLQTEGIQRIYSGSSSDATQGGGSNLWFQTADGTDVDGIDKALASEYLKAIRVAFIQDLGKSNGTATVKAFARADLNTGDLYLCESDGTQTEDAVILDDMVKNTAYQITAVVWLDGDSVTNANMAISTEILNKATLNLQFATDVQLVPAANKQLENVQNPTTNAGEAGGEGGNEGGEGGNEGGEQGGEGGNEGGEGGNEGGNG